MIVQNGDTLLNKSYGYADLGFEVPVDNKTKFRLASGPTILGTLLIQEVEKGKLSLDEDITKHIPEFPWQGKSITLSELMNASSGIPDYLYQGDSTFYKLAVPKTLFEITDLFADLPIKSGNPVRTGNNLSDHLAGIFMERVSALSFQALIEERIIHPLGLKNSSYCDLLNVTKELTTGYFYTYYGDWVLTQDGHRMYPFVSTFCANSGDILRLHQAIRSGELISNESYQKMITLIDHANLRLEKSGIAAGQGINVGLYKNYKWMANYSTMLGGFSSSVNTSPLWIWISWFFQIQVQQALQVADHMSKSLFNLMLKLPIPDRNPFIRTKPSFKKLPVSAQEMDQFSGDYKFSGWNRTIEIYRENGRFMYKVIGEFPHQLYKKSENVFVTTDGFLKGSNLKKNLVSSKRFICCMMEKLLTRR